MHSEPAAIEGQVTEKPTIRIVPPEPPEHFSEITPQAFYGKFWPQYSRKVSAIRTNFPPPKGTKEWEKGKPWERPIYVVWGTRAKDQEAAKIYAVVIADEEAERYWVDPDLMK